jgi:hypothetical protein
MKLALLVASAAVLSGPAKAPAPAPAERPIRLAATCFKTGENAPPGSMTKICYYDCLGSPVAITISSVKLCPLTINR